VHIQTHLIKLNYLKSNHPFSDGANVKDLSFKSVNILFRFLGNPS